MKRRRLLLMLLVAPLAAEEMDSPSYYLSPPKPQVWTQPQALIGGQQAKAGIRLASVSPVAATGELSLAFTPGVPGNANDSGVTFLANGARTIPFTVAVGEDIGRFDGKVETEFQTGTTAGSITFTARLGSFAEQLAVVVPSGYVVIDSASATRTGDGINLQITGFDTSRSASWLSFTFFDLTGRTVAPGTIQVDATSSFRQYFDQFSGGSMFTLRALFPISGDSSQIGAAAVVLSNSLGSTQTNRMTIR